MSSFLHRFAAEFASLDADKLERLGELYSDDVHFTDPLHEVVAWPNCSVTSPNCTPTSSS